MSRQTEPSTPALLPADPQETYPGSEAVWRGKGRGRGGFSCCRGPLPHLPGSRAVPSLQPSRVASVTNRRSTVNTQPVPASLWGECDPTCLPTRSFSVPPASNTLLAFCPILARLDFAEAVVGLWTNPGCRETMSSRKRGKTAFVLLRLGLSRQTQPLVVLPHAQA